jgi:hypothetical protein
LPIVWGYSQMIFFGEGEVKTFVVCMGEEKTNNVRRLERGEEAVRSLHANVAKRPL